MKTKITKESRNLMIAMLIGDGSISIENGFRMTHCGAQKEYLNWKIKQLGEHGIRTCGLKSYISSKGYKVGTEYFYTRLNVLPFTKTLRRVFYKNGRKNIANVKLLNRLDAKGLAIWFMDDGCLNHRKNFGLYVKLSTCLNKPDAQILIDYFKEKWNINFYTFSEGKSTFSLACGTHEALKFLDIVKPYVQQVPCMSYKIKYNLSGRKRPVEPSGSKLEASLANDEDIVCSALQNAAVNNGAGLTQPPEH